MLNLDFFENFLEEKKITITDLAKDLLFTDDKYKPASMVEWVEKNRVLNGKSFSYSNSEVFMELGEFDKPITKAPRPYLLDYLKDPCRDKTIIKCRQSEFTENELNINLFLAMTRPFTQIMHVFPTQRLGEQIARQKIQSAVKGSPKIMAEVEKPLAYTFYKFQNGANYSIGGSWGNIAGRAGSFDKLTFDEYEFHNPTVEGVFLRLIDHSALKQICRISTPLFPGGGIDLKYEEGCKFEWFVQCPECGKVQTLKFPENIINFFDVGYLQRDSEKYIQQLNKAYIGCSHCKAYIDRTSSHYLATSKWVAEKPHLVGIKNSYRITAFLLPWKTGKEILAEFHKAKYSYQFDNEILGYASKSKDSSLQELYFLRCENKSLMNLPQKISNLRNVSFGVDWGTTDIGSWLVVRAKGVPPYVHKTHIVYMERIDRKSLQANGYLGDDIDHAKRVEQLINIFNPKIVINDANGIGTDRNSYLIRKFPRLVYGCFYDTGEITRQKLHKSKVIEPIWSTNKVTVSRVGSFRMMMEDYKALDENGVPEIFIPLIGEDGKEFVAHHLNIGVQKMFDQETGVEYEIVGKSGPDHYCFSGDTLIMTDKGEVQIKDIKAGDFVLTRKGFKTVLWAGTTGVKLVKEYYINNVKLKSTENHKIWTKMGFKKISLLMPRDICNIIDIEVRILCNMTMQLKSFIKGLYSGDIRMPREEMIESIIRQIRICLEQGLALYTEKFGKICMEKFRKDFVFIIKTIIPIIMRLVTSNVCLLPNIEVYMEKNIIKDIEKKILKYLQKRVYYQKVGIKQKKGKNFMQNWRNICGSINTSRFVSFVKKNMKRSINTESFAAELVPLRIDEIVAWITKKEYAKLAENLLSSINILKPGFVNRPVSDIEKEKVYDLTVSDEHEYFANGILVSNSHADNYSKIGFDKINAKSNPAGVI